MAMHPKLAAHNPFAGKGGKKSGGKKAAAPAKKSGKKHERKPTASKLPAMRY